jgi:hypothetical protein
MNGELKHAITACPVCSGQLFVSELTCPSCGTRVSGGFEMCSVCRLPKEMYEFLMVFIKTRGSIKEMEKELGVSYPTVRGRLDELQRQLGFQAQDTATASVKEIIDMLEQGEVTAEQAEEMLKNR